MNKKFSLKPAFKWLTSLAMALTLVVGLSAVPVFANEEESTDYVAEAVALINAMTLEPVDQEELSGATLLARISQAEENVESQVEDLLYEFDDIEFDIITVNLTDAIAGEEGDYNDEGTDGTFVFYVVVNEEDGESDDAVRSINLTLNIIATPFEEAGVAQVADALSDIEGALPDDVPQDYAATSAAALAYVRAAILDELDGELNEYITFTLVPGTFVAAMSGVESRPEGVDGSISFTIEVVFDNGTDDYVDDESSAQTLDIIANAWNNPSLDAIAAAVEALEAEFADFSVPQATLNTRGLAEDHVETAVAAFVATLTNVEIDDITFGAFVPAIAEGAENARDGALPFRVTLVYDDEYEDTTSELTLVVTQTPDAPQWWLDMTPEERQEAYELYVAWNSYLTWLRSEEGAEWIAFVDMVNWHLFRHYVISQGNDDPGYPYHLFNLDALPEAHITIVGLDQL